MKKIKVMSGKKIVGFLVAVLMITTMISQFNRTSVSAEVVENVDNMAELKTKAEAATQDTTFVLSNAFDVNLTQQYDITISQPINIVVEGSSKTLQVVSNTNHLRINNNSTGTVYLKNLFFDGDTGAIESAIQKGGVILQGSNFALDNVTLNHTLGGVNANGVASLHVANSTFTNNYRSAGSGAIFAEGGIGNLTVLNSSFVGNSGGQYGYPGGAIWVKFPKIVNIDNSYFKDNISYGTTGGGAIAFTVGGANDIKITNSYFEANRADSTLAGGSSWSDGGAIYYLATQNSASAHSFVVDSSTFVNNYAQDDGGAILLEAPSATATTKVINSTFVGNQANGKGPQPPIGASGGAVQVSLNTTVDFVSNTMYNNLSGGAGTLLNQEGGAIATYVDQNKYPVMNLYDNLIFGNRVTDMAGNVISSNYSNVQGDNVVDVNNIGVDNGTALEATLTVEKIFGTANPVLTQNYSSTPVGNANSSIYQAYIPTLPISIKGPAAGTGNTGGYDARGFLRKTTPDLGAIDSVSLSFDANGGSWSNLTPLAYDGTVYYEGVSPTTYHAVAYNGANVLTIDDSNLANGTKTFLGWASDPNSTSATYGAGETIALGNTNQTLYAIWQDATTNHVINFNSNGGTSIENQTVLDNEMVVKPANPVRDGYNFEGWYSDDTTFANLYDFATPVTSSFTLHAKWSEKVTPTKPTTPSAKTPNKVSSTKPATGDTTNVLAFGIIGAIASAVLVGYALRQRYLRK